MYESRLQASVFDPEDLHGLRSRIDAETVGEYAAFRNGLTADYAKIRRDLASGYAALAATVAGVGIIGPIAVPIGAMLIGFFIAFVQLFIHEAAHYGLAADRRTNDRIANRLICWQVGTDIASYRATHWEHHRSLGTSKDTEVSYRNSLNPGFVAAMLIGIHALRVFVSRKEGPAKGKKLKLRPLLVGLAAHFCLIVGLVLLGCWQAAVAWLAGMSIFFPFFATLRQLLEHRPTDGSEGAVTRLFGDDMFSRTFGGAGFNRHMLHHLEPQVSYTRLVELEKYLMATSASAELNARRCSYWSAFVAIVRSDLHG
ncbi:MAG TPA: fatty acid desaturase [Sphingomicrobium sp.]